MKEAIDAQNSPISMEYIGVQKSQMKVKGNQMNAY